MQQSKTVGMKKSQAETMKKSQRQQRTKLYNSQFAVRKKISQGSFGVVYLGSDIKTKQHVAIKIEIQASDGISCFQREVSILSHLQTVPQIPKLLWHADINNEQIMVMELLGRDLTYYLRIFKKFSINCVINIGLQIIQVLENVHQKHIIHRDIKPENIIVGRDTESDKLYLVDFGISKFYKNNQGVHIEFSDDKPFIGTTRYASIAAHKKYEMSRRDDLESLGYMLVYLLKGNLPWQLVKYANEDEKLEISGQMKQKLGPAEICKDLPKEFTLYLEYCLQLSFDQEPNYKYLQKLLLKLQANYNFKDQEEETKFDWSDERTRKFKKSQNIGLEASLLLVQPQSSRQIIKPSSFKQLEEPEQRQNRKREDSNLQYNAQNLYSLQIESPYLPTEKRSNKLVQSQVYVQLDRSITPIKSFSSFNDSCTYSDAIPETSFNVAQQFSIFKQRILHPNINRINSMSKIKTMHFGSGKRTSYNQGSDPMIVDSGIIRKVNQRFSQNVKAHAGESQDDCSIDMLMDMVESDVDDEEDQNFFPQQNFLTVSNKGQNHTPTDQDMVSSSNQHHTQKEENDLLKKYSVLKKRSITKQNILSKNQNYSFCKVRSNLDQKYIESSQRQRMISNYRK